MIWNCDACEVKRKRRDKQIAELKKRLATLQSNSVAKPVSRKPAAKPKKTKVKAKKTLYAAPKEKDDLKKINGIGPVMEKVLNSLGVTSFKQVANFKKIDIAKVSDALDTFPGRIERDNWVGGAKEQYRKKYGTKA